MHSKSLIDSLPPPQDKVEETLKDDEVMNVDCVVPS